MARYPVPSHSGTVLRGAGSRSFGALARVGYPNGAVGGPSEVRATIAVERQQVALGPRFSLPPAGTSAQVIAVGLATETDTALSTAWAPKNRSLNLATETDTAFAIVALIQRRSFPTQKPRTPINPPQVLRGPRLYAGARTTTTVAAGLSTETDSALALTRLKTAAVGLSTETDTALAITVVTTTLAKPKITQAVALPGAIVRMLGSRIAAGARSTTTVAVGLATETDTATASTRLKTKAIGLASETDTATATGRLKTVALGLATESDSALAVSGGLTAAVIPKVARAVLQPKQVLIEQRSRTVSALVKSTIYRYADPAALETDTALAMTVLRTKAIGIASETDTALAATWAPKIRITGLASETDTALALGVAAVPTHVKALRGARLPDAEPGARSHISGALVDVGNSTYGPPTWNGTSPNTAIRAGGTNRVPITRNVNASEHQIEFDESSQTLSILQTPSPWQVATEADTANPLTVNRSFPVGIAIETNSAFQMTRIKGVWTSTAQATETDIAFPITRGAANVYIALNYAQETDSAFSITREGPQVIILGVADEREEALALIGGVTPTDPRRNRQYGRYSLRNQRR